MTGVWSDLPARLISAAVLIAVGGFHGWIGGHGFHVLVAVICGAMIWELARMLSPQQTRLALALAGTGGIAVLGAAYLPPLWGLVALAVPVVIGAVTLMQGRRVWMMYAPVVVLAGLSLVGLRDTSGAGWLIWLVAVVVASDVLGYFAGRLIGGPKFWPRISPRKTWSGTVAGWVGAALVGWAAMGPLASGPALIALSVALSLAAQLGDIAESAIKRGADVKDSSRLIPGHGGVMDRFDGMVGAAVMLLLAGPIAGLPGAA